MRAKQVLLTMFTMGSGVTVTALEEEKAWLALMLPTFKLAKAVFASHVSSEPAARLVLDALHKKPLITADLHLGEGTGAVASLPLWDMALAVYNGCYSFAEGGITPYTPQC